MPNNLAKTWPERFWLAIPVGADLSQVTDKFLLWALADEKHGVLQYVEGDAVASIQKVISLYGRKVLGEERCVGRLWRVYLNVTLHVMESTWKGKMSLTLQKN